MTIIAPVECSSSSMKPEEEVDWLPNPYQALADAQVLAGAWPMSPMLIQGTPVLLAAPQTPQQWVPAQIVIDDRSCWACDVQGVSSGDAPGYQALSPAPWNMLHDCSTGSLAGSYCDTQAPSSHEDDMQSVEDSSGRTTPQELQEGDDRSSTFGASDRRPGTPPPGVRYPRRLSHRCVPKGTDLGERFSEEKAKDEITTLMIRNIPNVYTRTMLVEELDSLNFGGEYDFLYLPIDKSTQWNVGYAFVNFKDPEVAKLCMKTMANYVFQRFEHGSGKVTQISAAHIQGLARNLAYYSNTAVQCAGSQTNRPLVLPAGRQDAGEASRRPHRRRRRARGAHAPAVAA